MLGTVSIRRSAGMVRNTGESTGVHEGDTKSGKPRLVDMNDDAATVLRAYRKDRGSMALQLITADSLVFGAIGGRHRNPEHVSRQFVRDVERCRQALGAETVSMIRLHDLRTPTRRCCCGPASRCTLSVSGSGTPHQWSPSRFTLMSCPATSGSQANTCWACGPE